MILSWIRKYRYHKHLHTLLGLIVGLFVGHVMTVQTYARSDPLCQLRYTSSLESIRNNHISNEASKSMIIPTAMQKARSKASHTAYRIDQLPLRPTSHAGVLKRSLVEPFTLHPHLAGVSYATIDAGKNIDLHQHTSMSEVFYVVQGTGWVQFGGDHIDPSRYQHIQEGSYVFIGPQWNHSFGASADQSLTLLFFGVTDD